VLRRGSREARRRGRGLHGHLGPGATRDGVYAAKHDRRPPERDLVDGRLRAAARGGIVGRPDRFEAEQLRQRQVDQVSVATVLDQCPVPAEALQPEEVLRGVQVCADPGRLQSLPPSGSFDRASWRPKGEERKSAIVSLGFVVASSNRYPPSSPENELSRT
jgi:hypothetical protein